MDVIITGHDLNGNEEILNISYEYALAYIFKDYSSKKGFKDIDTFNSNNNFNFYKLVLYPFFISTSNGHSNSLMKLFGDFRNRNVGILSRRINNFLINNNSIFFEFDANHNIRIKDNFKYNNSFDSLINAIMNKPLNIGCSSHFFKNLKINNDNDEKADLIYGIESGIKVLNKQSSDDFFNFSEYDVVRKGENFITIVNKKSSSTIISNSIIDYEIIKDNKNELLYYSENYN